MVFNSSVFFFFLILIYLLYLALSINYRWQNFLLLAASYFFYGFWDYRFLGLLFISTLNDYIAAFFIEKAHQNGQKRRAKIWLCFSLSISLGILGFFKYYNFFADNLHNLSHAFGIELNTFTLKVVLPAGISFYTFQTMGYVIDVYRGKQKAATNFLDFSLFVSFFPQLMAGPIERAEKLLTQIQLPRKITTAQTHDGLWLILWGLFKKVFIADNLAPYIRWGFELDGASTSADIYLVLVVFSILFYCDFSGYSDMAVGLGKLFGVELTRNFNLPYFSENPADFWRRWHIALANWFRNYVYGPLKNNSRGLRRVFAAFFTMFLVGLWHGAGWNYIIWGSLWGITLILYTIFNHYAAAVLSKMDHRLNGLIRFLGIILTFHLWLIIGMFFVTPNVPDALHRLRIMFTDFSASPYLNKDAVTVLFYSWPLVAIQFIQYFKKDIDIMSKLPPPFEICVCFGLIMLLILNGAQFDKEFIYFKF